jgi:adenine-specific DNA glycosylase
MAEGNARAALSHAGLHARLGSAPVGEVEHALTHRHLRIDVYRASAARGSESDTRRPFTAGDLEKVGISTLTKKLLAATFRG